jgi:hypothetical protein
MAQINIGEENNVVTPKEEIVVENENKIETTNGSLSNNASADEEKLLPPSDKIVGLADQELKDPNKISVTIADGDAPVVVLFGPPACGKTMTLVRLTRYLRKNGYSVTPIRTFRPTYDSNYTEICDNFDEMMNQDNAAESTGRISFMLVKVSKNGKTICQILEAPGEYYFNPKNPKSPFPRYFHTISSGRNRKIWTIMVEPDWQNTSDRLNYKDRIKLLRRYMSTKDKTIFVYNKIDKTEFLIDNSGNAHVGLARKSVKDLYPGIFEPFINPTPIARWFVPYKFDFSIFQTGEYSKANDGTYMFTPGPDVFPRRLWQLIMKRIRG